MALEVIRGARRLLQEKGTPFYKNREYDVLGWGDSETETAVGLHWLASIVDNTLNLAM